MARGLPRLLRKPPMPFPLGAPTRPVGVDVPEVRRRTGADYDTAWARRYGARVARAFLIEGVARPLMHAVVPPDVTGYDRLVDLDGPVVFAPNHASHLDTGLMLSTLPRRFRHKTVVAAGADYFFDTRMKAAAWSLAVAAIPVERTRVSRRAADLASELLQDGWSVVIFPEGTRTPDGWVHSFRGGAAYLSIRTGAPVVPVHIGGTYDAMGKDRPFRPGRTSVTFGPPLTPADGEDARRLAARLEAEVAVLADEVATDWWSARRRASAGTTPSLSGPTASPWRRAWMLPEPPGGRSGQSTGKLSARSPGGGRGSGGNKVSTATSGPWERWVGPRGRAGG
jgi:1-acyl-sn-glycerol-3-phosphate acyltransferase